MAQKNIVNQEPLEEDKIDKRQKVFTRKALQNAVEEKRRQMIASKTKLVKILKATEGLNTGTETENILRDITHISEEFKVFLEELYELYAQDKYKLFGDEALLNEESLLLKHAYFKIQRIKNSQSDKLLDSKSVRSRNSRRSESILSRASACSSARLKALAEAAAARESAEYDKMLAQRELERKTREQELERQREEERAKYERDTAILSANKKVAIADAKLKALDQALEDELNGSVNSFEDDIPPINENPNENEESQQRTRDWVGSNEFPTETVPRGDNDRENHAHSPQTPRPQHVNFDFREINPQNRFGCPPYMSTPIRDITGNNLIESLTSANQQIVAGLARQNLPKCQPDVFSGDATLFHPWKAAFKAMIEDANVSPIQEINYLRSFTSGQAQRLVDNYRKRQNNYTTLLTDLWKELERRFGSTAVITTTLLERMNHAAAFNENDNAKLQHFADLCSDIESQMSNLPGLASLNYPNAIQPIAAKLPPSIKSKWEKTIAKHGDKYDGQYPGFDKFAKIIKDQATLKNNPNILAGNKPSRPLSPATNTRRANRVLKSSTELGNTRLETKTAQPNENKKRCLFHDRLGHDIFECKAFAAKALEEKTDWVQKAGLCYRCLHGGHLANQCKNFVKCTVCGDERHIALLHRDDKPKIEAKCTSVCGDTEGGVSCSKVILVDVYPKTQPHHARRVYAVIDEQSNASLISSELADFLEADGPLEEYYLSTCSQEKELKYGRRVNDITACGFNGSASDLPTMLECDTIPQSKREIPTPAMARRFKHLESIAEEIPPFDDTVGVHVLIGRDAPELLKVREFKNGPRGAPWAHKLSLGWTIIGQVCLDLVDGATHVQVKRTQTHVTPGQEQYELQSCPNQIKVYPAVQSDRSDIFFTTREDNQPSLSCDDRKFLEIMTSGVHKNKDGNWEMPLPFRHSSNKLPCNRGQAVHRLNGLLRTLRKKPQMFSDYIEFMGKILSRGHASPVPSKDPPQEGRTWYLPHFGVYHPKKPDQIRVVFDSSAEYEGISLNRQLIPGPDMMNNLLGVLMRFRKESVAVMCDIEQMFHSFFVNQEDRDYLRFLWFDNNTPGEPIVEYRMNVHLFGNGPSPAVATFGLRKTAIDGEEEFGADASKFVQRNFYVDDGLISLPSVEQATSLVRSAQTMLATANLRLHKVVSNSVEVMEAFPAEDRAKDVRDLDLRQDSLPSQRSLGVHWDLEHDAFTFKVSLQTKPFTRRGVLSIVNSIYDPLGFAVPVLLEGRLLLQKLVSMGKKENDTPLGWDDPLPDTLLQQWQRWRDSLVGLESVRVPRCYHPKEFGTVTRAELHAFSDASKDAIGVAVYLRLFDENAKVSTALLFGQSKVAPIQATSIPRLELCGAVLATQAVVKITNEIDMTIDEVYFYTDSKVVLGYIQNESRRFYVYVANRVQAIRKVSESRQWRYVETSENPADLATRSISPTKLAESSWLTGPDFLKDASLQPTTEKQYLLEDLDPEVRKAEANIKATQVDKAQSLGSDRFKRFSNLTSLQRAIANLIVTIKEFRRREEKSPGGARVTKTSNSSGRLRVPTVKESQQAMNVILRTVQQDSFKGQQKSDLQALNPFVHTDGLLRVGGRLRHAQLEFCEKHPVLLPKDCHVTQLVVRHYHDKVHHQGRQITHGAIRQAGFWLVGGHRAVAKEISRCVNCKKIRGSALQQQMADLPQDRIEVAPPFTNVGFDVFGPWMIKTRKTRGGVANSKRWGLVLTCLSSRAIHIEVLESMDTDSFLCALRRFFAIRGPAALLRCDRGTNFVGAKSELEDAMKETVDQRRIETFVKEQGCEWKFNPPHASHFGGAWERQILTIRRVLNAMLKELGERQLTHELLVTLMAEVAAIVNARPLTAIPTDADDPQPLSPAMLLTMKKRPLGPLPGNFVPADVYARRRWRRVQYLADQFWVRWKREYLQSLQPRNKWRTAQKNLTVGDVVLVKDATEPRNHWPMGRIVQPIESDDGKVRKAEVKIMRDGKTKTYLRPLKELVLLVEDTDKSKD